VAVVYSPKAAQYYGAGEAYDQKAFNIAQSFKGKPNAMVTIYRAVPKVTSNSEKLATLSQPLSIYTGNTQKTHRYNCLVEVEALL
jgi:hypothetical protein